MYEYHGAEHKTVFAFENGDPLDTAAVQKYSTFHPRCGTSFLMTVMIISIVVYMLDSGNDFLGTLRRAYRVVAGDRRASLRDHSIRREASRISVRPDDRAGPVVAAHHHAASVGRRRLSVPSLP